MHTNTSDEVVTKTESDSPQQCPATGQEAVVQTETQKTPFICNETPFLSEGCPTLAQVAQNIIESPSLELWSWATFLVDPALRRIGLDDLKGSLPISTVL